MAASNISSTLLSQIAVPVIFREEELSKNYQSLYEKSIQVIILLAEFTTGFCLPLHSYALSILTFNTMFRLRLGRETVGINCGILTRNLWEIAQ